MKTAFFLILFAYDGPAGLPAQSHTFAAMVKVDNGKATVDCISWMCRDRAVILRRSAQVGENWTLGKTLAWANVNRRQMVALGPYQIPKSLYDAGLRRKAQLESGQVFYRLLDRKARPNATNCQHAISDIVLDRGLLLTGGVYGEEILPLLRAHFRLNGRERCLGVVDRIGLKNEKITWKP